MNLADLILTLVNKGYTMHFTPFSATLNEMRIVVRKSDIMSDFIVAQDFLPRDREDYLCGIISQLVTKINRKEEEDEK